MIERKIFVIFFPAETHFILVGKFAIVEWIASLLARNSIIKLCPGLTLPLHSLHFKTNPCCQTKKEKKATQEHSDHDHSFVTLTWRQSVTSKNQLHFTDSKEKIAYKYTYINYSLWTLDPFNRNTV